jgi:hypothetical protein
LRNFIIPAVFVSGLSIVFGLALQTPEFPGETKVLAGPVINSQVSGTQSGCAAMGGKRLKSTDSSLGNVTFHIALGHLADGSPAEVSLVESNLTADIYTPDVLGFSMPSGRNGAELIPDDSRLSRKISDGTPHGGYMTQPLRQVKVPDTLLDIVVISQWEYELRFYRPDHIGARGGKVYELVGDPHAVYRFRNPNPPSVDRLEITTRKQGTEDKAEYFHNAELDLWTLNKNGQEVVRKRSEVNPNDPCERIETRIETKGSKVLKTVKIYKGFPWGQEIVKKIENPEGEAKTTTYKYFEDVDGPHYSFLKTTIHPNGEVERHNEQPDPTMPFRKQP